MWNIRMRASKKGKRQKAEDTKQDFHNTAGAQTDSEIHISGAEGIYSESEIPAALLNYTKRALAHTRGRPDKIVLTIEALGQKPLSLRSLPVATVKCISPSEAKQYITDLLQESGISSSAAKTALDLLKRKNTLRGAALVLAASGKRVEPDALRGVRVSRLGITSHAASALLKKMAGRRIDTQRITEALILATKVSSCKQVAAEICISDNPDYTTGYFASRRFGYVRIPHIKRAGSSRGGRVFFLKDDADVGAAVHYLEKTPVLISKTDKYLGELSLYELFDHYHK